MNCNHEAFKWIIDFVKIKTENEGKSEDDLECLYFSSMDEIDLKNCLNILVTAYFLQLTWVYDMVWNYYFQRNFADIINSCKISLTNINPQIVKDVATKIPDIYLEQMDERKDKFISNVYKAKIDEFIINSGISLYWCNRC